MKRRVNPTTTRPWLLRTLVCEGLPSMKMWPQQLAKPGVRGALWSLCSVLSWVTRLICCPSPVSAEPRMPKSRFTLPATLSAQTATDAQGSRVLRPLRLESLRHPTLSPEGTQVRVLSRVSPQASWEIYCPGNEGRDRLRKRRRREEKVRWGRRGRWRRERKHGERKRRAEGEGEGKRRRKKCGVVKKRGGMG